MLIYSKENKKVRSLETLACFLIFSSPLIVTADDEIKSNTLVIAKDGNVASYSEIIDDRVSFDNFFSYDTSNKAIDGDGSGDVILLMVDDTSKGPRKKSLMVDLSFTNPDKSLNDFTVNDILSLSQQLMYSNPQLTRFINTAKKPQELKWSIYGIADHFSSQANDMTSLRIINSGLVSTQINWPNKAISYSDIHNLQALLSDLIINNNDYGLESNSSFISFSAEASFYLLSLYGYIDKDIPSYGLLNDELVLGMHQKKYDQVSEENISKVFGSSYQKLGKVKFLFDESINEWTLLISPINSH